MVEGGEYSLQPVQEKFDAGSQGGGSSREKTSEEKGQGASPKQVDKSEKKTPPPPPQSPETVAQNTSRSRSEIQQTLEDDILGAFVFTNPIPSPVRPLHTHRPYRFRKKQGGNDQSPCPNNSSEAKS